jgi:hypothetical protein
MGIQLNFESAKAHALAIEVAELTDQSITHAVIEALKAQKRALSKDARKARIMAFVSATGSPLTGVKPCYSRAMTSRTPMSRARDASRIRISPVCGSNLPARRWQ